MISLNSVYKVLYILNSIAWNNLTPISLVPSTHYSSRFHEWKKE